MITPTETAGEPLLSDGENQAAVEAALKELLQQAMWDDACTWDGELHGTEIFHQSKDWAKCTIPRAVQVFDDALALLAQHDLEIIARGTNLARFRSRYGPAADPYTWNFSNLMERLNERLRAREDYGLVIADDQSQYKRFLQAYLANAHRVGTGGYRSSKLERILDTAHFVDSRLSPMTQLVDLVTFVLRRRATRRQEHDARVEVMMSRWYGLIVNAFPEPSGQYHTIRS